MKLNDSTQTANPNVEFLTLDEWASRYPISTSAPNVVPDLLDADQLAQCLNFRAAHFEAYGFLLPQRDVTPDLIRSLAGLGKLPGVHHWEGDEPLFDLSETMLSDFDALVTLTNDPLWKMKTMPEFLEESLVESPYIVPDLLKPGSITMFSAPAGLGKTQLTIMLGGLLSQGGIFRGEKLNPVRVCYICPDNPRDYMRSSFKNWGVDSDLLTFKGRGDTIPQLIEQEKWAKFQADEHDLIILDSWGSLTTGISEREGAKFTIAADTLVALAGKGLSVCLLNNTLKSGESFKGRQELEDRIDRHYELRDATELDGVNTDEVKGVKAPWYIRLPKADAADFQDWNIRHQGKTSFRLGFIPTAKSRGPQVAPFCLELNLSQLPWMARDVTDELEAAPSIAKTQDVLIDLVEQIKAMAPEPYSKTAATNFLQTKGIGRNKSRDIIQNNMGVLWNEARGDNKRGRPSKSLILVSATSSISVCVSKWQKIPSSEKDTGFIFCHPDIQGSAESQSGEKSPNLDWQAVWKAETDAYLGAFADPNLTPTEKASWEAWEAEFYPPLRC